MPFLTCRTVLEPVKALSPSFFENETALVARNLLGHRIVQENPDGFVSMRIVETEAYQGPDDPASHARFGPDSQAHRMWETPGTAYVYICYGIHQMLNVVAHKDEKESAGAVLFRAAEPEAGIETLKARRGKERERAIGSGPGKLTQALAIERERHDGIDLTRPEGLFLAEGSSIPNQRVAITGRVGISQGQDRPLRFADSTSRCVSSPLPTLRPTKDETGERSRKA